MGADAFAELGRRFENEHERRYGHKFAGAYALEIVNLRLVGTIPLAARGAIAREARGGPAGEGRRTVHFGPAFAPEIETPIIARGALGPGARAGPLIVEERDCTTVVPPDCRAGLDQHGNIVIMVGGEPEGGGG